MSCFLKCEEESSGDIHTPLAVTVNVDLSWEATILGLPCSIVFSSLPQVIKSVPDVEAILEFVDSCTLCVGNADEKFGLLVSSREGRFMDISGE